MAVTAAIHAVLPRLRQRYRREAFVIY
jgi:hypothetical protein